MTLDLLSGTAFASYRLRRNLRRDDNVTSHLTAPRPHPPFPSKTSNMVACHVDDITLASYTHTHTHTTPTWLETNDDDVLQRQRNSTRACHLMSWASPLKHSAQYPTRATNHPPTSLLFFSPSLARQLGAWVCALTLPDYIRFTGDVALLSCMTFLTSDVYFLFFFVYHGTRIKQPLMTFIFTTVCHFCV